MLSHKQNSQMNFMKQPVGITMLFTNNVNVNVLRIPAGFEDIVFLNSG